MPEIIAQSIDPENVGLQTPFGPRLEDGGFMYDQQSLGNGLPPDAMWVVPKDDCKSAVETPLDDRGLIDIDSLILTCKSLISPDYAWPQLRSRHHLYWTEDMYKDYQRANPASFAVAFRELPINIGLMPRQFENVIHFVTKPAPIPDAEMMRMQTESWRVAHSLFKNVRETIKLERLARHRKLFVAANPKVLKPEFNGEDIIGQEVINELFERHFRGIDRHLDAIDDMPLEFRLVDRSKTTAEMAEYIGRIVGNKSIPLVRSVLYGRAAPVAA